MRTDRRLAGEPGTTFSRRGFLVAGGTAAGVAVGGTAGARETEDGVITVAATEPYLPAVRAAVEDVEATTVSTAAESDEAMTADGAGDRLDEAATVDAGADRTADVVVSGRPAGGSDTQGGVVVDAAAALEHRENEWRECLPTSELRDRWAGDAPVEAWCETDRQDVAPDAHPPAAGDAEPTVLVHGTRSYQYAQGQGGAGHYAVDRGELTDPSTAEDGTGVPVARLAYVRVDRDALPDERIGAFLERYGRPADGAASAAPPRTIE